MEDKVSIIIPIYNMENYLGKCIESIIKQSYKNIEIILINDGSTDRSEIICKKYQIKDKRIKVIFSENKGVSNARNLGIEASTGEYMLFIDPDDTVDERYIEEMLTCIKEYYCDVVFCLAKHIYPKLNKIYTIKLENEEKISNDFIKDFYLIAEQFHTPWGKLYKSDIIKKYDIKFPIDLITSEDQVFNQEYLKHIKTYRFLNRNLYNYYIRNNSISRNLDEKHFEADVKNLKIKKLFLFNELKLINENEKNVYLFKCTKSIIYKYLNLQSIKKDEFKKIKRRVCIIRKTVEIEDLLNIKMSLKEYMIVYFLKNNKWMYIYIIALLKYLKKYICY